MLAHRDKRSRSPDQGSFPLIHESDEDSRIDAFRRWIAAVDRRDISATSRAAKELRSLRVGIVPLAPKAIGGDV